MDGAKYMTPQLEQVVALDMLKMHVAANHAIQEQAQGVVTGNARPEKYNLFNSSWDRYKRSTGLVDATTVRDKLVEACLTELYEDLYNLLGSVIDQKTEVQLLVEMKSMAVVSQNIMVNMVRLRSIVQDRDEPITSYLAKPKSASSVCKLTVKSNGNVNDLVSFADQEVLHCLVKGLSDEDIRAWVLGCMDKMVLEATVK